MGLSSVIDSLIFFKCCAYLKWHTSNLVISSRILRSFSGNSPSVFSSLFILFTILYVLIFYSLNGYINNFDRSLGIRSNKIFHVFHQIDLKYALVPIGSKYNLSMINSMHNEYLQLYVWLGLPFVIWFYYLILKYVNIIRSIDLSFALLMLVIVFIGGSIQLNLLQSYSGILIALLISCFMNVRSNVSRFT